MQCEVLMPRSFERDIWPLLQQLGTLLGKSQLFDWASAQAGVSIERPSMTVLVTLSLGGRAMRVGDIAHQMGVEGPHVTRHVNSLQKRGLVERVVDASDARARLVELTESGAIAAEKYQDALFGLLDDVIQDWDESRRQAFTDSLRALTDGISQQLQKRSIA